MRLSKLAIHELIAIHKKTTEDDLTEDQALPTPP
jgi:hypothetical protein